MNWVTCPPKHALRGLSPYAGIGLSVMEDSKMITETEAKSLIDDLFEEQALVIGGLVAVHEVDDDLVWRLVRSLDATRRKALRRFHDKNGGEDDVFPNRPPHLRPHPAIEEFIQKLRRS